MVVGKMTDTKKQRKRAAIVRRLSEPSTWAGLAALGVLVGATVEQVQAVAHAGAAVSGVLAVLIGERA